MDAHKSVIDGIDQTTMTFHQTQAVALAAQFLGRSSDAVKSGLTSKSTNFPQHVVEKLKCTLDASVLHSGSVIEMAKMIHTIAIDIVKEHNASITKHANAKTAKIIESIDDENIVSGEPTVTPKHTQNKEPATKNTQNTREYVDAPKRKKSIATRTTDSKHPPHKKRKQTTLTLVNKTNAPKKGECTGKTTRPPNTKQITLKRTKKSKKITMTFGEITQKTE